MKKLLLDAQKRKYAVPQFNINNLEWTKYILEECELNKSPVILGVSESSIKYIGGYNVVVNMIKALMDSLNITIPVVIHLDHGKSVESCKKALNAGFNSIMIDGSKYNIDENIRLVKEVQKLLTNQTLEAEIGQIKTNDYADKKGYADINECQKLVKTTSIDCLAPALGSVHGLYKGHAKLDFKLMKDIYDKINLPLVLHGGSGLKDQIIQKSIENGICKINVNTELQLAWTKGIRKYLKLNKDVYDPRKIISSGEENLKQCVKKKIFLFKSNNKG